MLLRKHLVYYNQLLLRVLVVEQYLHFLEVVIFDEQDKKPLGLRFYGYFKSRRVSTFLGI